MRVYIDCTHTYHSELNTGIQRVVRNIVNHAEVAGKALGVECIPVVLTTHGYVRITHLNYSFKKRVLFRSRWRLNDYYFRLIGVLKKLLPFPSIVRFLTASKYEFGLVRLILLGLFPLRWLRHLMNRLSAGFKSTIKSFPRPSAGDVLFLPDSFWAYSFLGAVSEAKNIGVIVIAIIHDIFPVTQPKFVDKIERTKFESSLPKLYKHVDGFLCNSDYTKRTLIEYFQSQPFYQDWETKCFDYFHLGAELDTNSVGRIRDSIKKPFNDSAPAYLTVGTIEPRKNHIYLLKVFDELWKAGNLAKLVIVGKAGWLCDETMTYIRSHSMIGTRLFFIDDANDSELDYCYSHAKALLYPAIIEGFGLPLIEAQKKGLPVFASDIPVFHEVAGTSAAYFDNTNPQSLADMLLEYDRTGIFPADGPNEFTWPTWAESTSQMLTKLTRMANNKQPAIS
jgi:O-antigen biosynthesis alpha-1,2-rhamnosyltransferase